MGKNDKAECVPESGHAIFEATHGTAPKYADLDKVSPSSMILSGEMMLRYMGWIKAADLIINSLDKIKGGIRSHPLTTSCLAMSLRLHPFARLFTTGNTALLNNESWRVR